jgi:hypothetical protein
MLSGILEAEIHWYILYVLLFSNLSKFWNSGRKFWKAPEAEIHWYL